MNMTAASFGLSRPRNSVPALNTNIVNVSGDGQMSMFTANP